MTSAPAPRVLTGWHVFGIFAFCFSIIIGVNLTLAFYAVETFPGLETPNSYVTSQSFDADRAGQQALAWTVTPTWADGRLRFQIDGPSGPVQPDIRSATLGRRTYVADDIVPDWKWDGAGYAADVAGQGGAWVLRLELTSADGTPFRRAIALRADRVAP